MNKVIVMSAQDVAAMRKAHKEAEAAYYQAKVGALEFMAEEMKQTGEEYTATELSAMSGLSVKEITRNLSRPTFTAFRAGIHNVESRKSCVEEQYVRVLPTGKINPDQTVTIRRIKTLYSLPSRN